MIVYWPWGLMIAGLVTVTIWANGHHWRPGWLVGAAAQLAQIGFGVATGIWTFYFAALPLGMFLWNWWQHPRREVERKRKAGGVLVDVAGSDQMIMMSRGVLDRMIESAPPAPNPLPAIPTLMRGVMGAPWLSSPITPTSPQDTRQDGDDRG
jgi:hypothetical protein